MVASIAASAQDSNGSIVARMVLGEGRAVTDLRGRAQTINAAHLGHQSQFFEGFRYLSGREMVRLQD